MIGCAYGNRIIHGRHLYQKIPSSRVWKPARSVTLLSCDTRRDSAIAVPRQYLWAFAVASIHLASSSCSKD
jgi:hypothetical protein